MNDATIKRHCKKARADDCFIPWKKHLREAIAEGRKTVNNGRTLEEYACDAVIAACYPDSYVQTGYGRVSEQRALVLPQAKLLLSSMRKTKQ